MTVQTPLRQLSWARGVHFGAAAVWWQVLAVDPAMAKIFATEAGFITPDYEMKWSAVRPSAGTYVYDACDRLADFCRANQQKLRGHNLVWEESNPGWLANTLTSANAGRYLTDHIARLVPRYADVIHSWDVVNEPIWPAHGQPGGLRDGVWLRTLGSQYVDLAFNTARAYDPAALLCINEAGTECADTTSALQRKDLLALIDGLLDRGVPLGGIGLECHMSTESDFNTDDFAGWLDTLKSRHLKILITELDVNDVHCPETDVTKRDLIVANLYHDLVSTAMKNSNVISIQTWELSDKYSWLRGQKRVDGTAPRPLPYDELLQPKPARDALARAFTEAPVLQRPVT